MKNQWTILFCLLMTFNISAQTGITTRLDFNNFNSALSNNTLNVKGSTAGVNVSGVAFGNDYLYSVTYSNSDFDRNGTINTLTFDLLVEGFSNGDASYIEEYRASSATIGANDADVSISTNDPEKGWSVGDDMSNGKSLKFTVQNIVSNVGTVNFNGIDLLRPVEGDDNSHTAIIGQGNNLRGYLFNGLSEDITFPQFPLHNEPVYITGEALGNSSNWGVGSIDLQFTVTVGDVTTKENMLSYIPQHTAEISPYSWATPQRWTVMKGYDFTDAQIDQLCNSGVKVIHLFETEVDNFRARFPNILYKSTGANLERDYYLQDPEKYPEYYIYNEDGSLRGSVTGNPRDNYLNLLIPGARKFWLDSAQDLIDNNSSDIFFIDALAKAAAVATKSKFYDYWGNQTKNQNYFEDGLRPLLNEIRERFSDQVMIAGNFFRTNHKTCRAEWVEYIQCIYLEGFERDGDVSNAIVTIAPLIEEGRPMQLSINPDHLPPNRSPLLTQDEKNTKAQNAMPELWDKLTSGEQIELADMYAYFDYKLAMFLMVAGEHSYMKYALNTTPLKRGGTDFFRNIPPFPEWDMPLGKPIGPAVRNGDVWTRCFEYVNVTLNIGNGTAQFVEKKILNSETPLNTQKQ